MNANGPKLKSSWGHKLAPLLFSVLLASVVLSLTGCASTEPENYSARPWDSPRSWETGLPSALTEGR
jgi:hypothetical protein